MIFLFEKGNKWHDVESSIKACKELGYTYLALTIDQCKSAEYRKKDNKVVGIGSFDFFRKLSQIGINCINYPSSYSYLYSNLLQQHYNYLLNRGCLIIGIWDFIKNPWYYFQEFNSSEVFIKSDSGYKLIPGQLFKIEDMAKFESSFGHLDNTENIIVAKARPIYGEWRVIINIKEGSWNIVAASSYYFNNEFVTIPSIPEDGRKFVEKLPKFLYPLPVQGLFVLDIAQAKDTGHWYVVEINAVPLSNWYACSHAKILTAYNENYNETK